MPRQTMVFTALPDGPDLAGNLRLSVFISPRLFPDGEVGVLSDFPDLAVWPETLAGIGWSVLLDGVVVPATVVTPEPVSASAAWWRALLPGSTPVRGHTQPNYADREVVSYDVGQALGQLRGIWQRVLSDSPTATPDNRALLGQVATAVGWDVSGLDRLLAGLVDTARPPAGPDDAPPDDLDERPDVDVDVRTHGPGPEERRWRYDQESAWIDRQREAGQEYESYLAGREAHRRHVSDVRAELDPEAMLRTALAPLYAVHDFHEPRVRRADGAAYERPVVPDYDVHQRLAMLGSHPALLRRLGLVVDLELDLPAPLVGGTSVQVLADFAPVLDGDPTTTSPKTLLDPTTFRAAPDGADGQVDRGFLRVADADATHRVTAAVADVDGAALKTVASIEGLVRRLVWRDNEHDESSDGLPTLRSAGMALALSARGNMLQAAFAKARTRNVALLAATAELDADDLTRGWRLDVRPEGGEWLSTAARRARYTVGDLPALEVTEEGVLTPTASGVGNAREKPDGALYVPETLFLWQGWSLVVPRPGTPIDTADQVGAPDPLQVPGPLSLDYLFRVVPGTLPLLRFGRRYEFRLRAVDLAGGGPGREHPEPVAASVVTDAVAYLRFDPVLPPEVLVRTARGPGEAPARIVLRSDIDTAPSPPTAERHVVPPRSSQLLAEQHGLFDAAGRPAPSAYSTITAADGPHEAGTYAGLPGATQDPEFPGDGSSDDPGVWYVDVDRLPMVYLPDPLSAGAALRGLPGAAPSPVLVPFAALDGEAWPRLRPFRLVLQEGPPGHDWSADERVLAVSLPKGERCEVELSSWLDETALPLLGLRDWWRELGLDDVRRLEFDRAARQGEVWAITPPRRLLLVHAVARPVREPAWSSLVPVRAAGTSYATLTGELEFSRRTTGAVDLVATWAEPVDPGQGNVEAAAGDPEPVADPDPAQPRSSVLPLQLDGVGDPDHLAVARRQDFGDGRHREVTYRAVATTAFLEYFTRQREIAMPAVLPADVVLDPAGVVAGTVVLVDPDGAAYRVRDAASPGGAFRVDQAAGVLRFDADADGPRPAPLATLRATYNVPEVTRTSAPVTVQVPATVRPAPPKVLYVLPTFGWSSGGALDDAGVWSGRRGNSLRVYLDRPWWSSGRGELLGVVLLPPDGPLNEDARQYVTSWGDDPANAVRGPQAEKPGLQHFPEAVRSRAGLRAEEMVYRRMDVAGFDVAFHAERKLWFCDIAVDSGIPDRTYQPFVRLALARWQPESVPGFELSRVVMADFVQLGVDRAASVVRQPDGDSLLLTVTGTVPRERNAARAWIEVALPGVPDPDLGWEQADGTEVDLTPVAATGWQGLVRLPDVYSPGTFRLVLQEVERYPLSPVGPELGERLMYLDVLPL